MTVTDEAPKKEEEEKVSRRDRIMIALGKDPLSGVSKTWWILLFLGIALTAWAIQIGTRQDPVPAVYVNAGSPTVQPVDTGTTTEAAPRLENPLTALAEAQNRTLDPTLARVLQDPDECDEFDVCGYPNWAESNRIYSAILTEGIGDLCNLWVYLRLDGGIRLSYGPEYEAGMIPVLNCEEPLAELDDTNIVIDIEEDGRLPGITEEELGGE